jgi:hypothetical protein
VTDIERFRQWVLTYPGMPPDVRIDYTNETPDNAGLFPQGLVQISRTENSIGAVTIRNQYNFVLYFVFEKNEGGAAAAENAEFALGFQLWVQEQCALGLAPKFGGVNQSKETITAQNGALYSSPDSGTAMYYVLCSAQFQLFYER